MNDNSIGVYLKEKREELGISKYRLAKDSQLSHTYISQLESGLKSNPSPEILDKLAQALGINNIDLLIKAGVISQDDFKKGKEAVEEINSSLNHKREELLMNNGIVEGTLQLDKWLFVGDIAWKGRFITALEGRNILSVFSEENKGKRVRFDDSELTNIIQNEGITFKGIQLSDTDRIEINKYLNYLFHDRIVQNNN